MYDTVVCRQGRDKGLTTVVKSQKTLTVLWFCGASVADFTDLFTGVTDYTVNRLVEDRSSEETKYSNFSHYK